MENMFSFAVTKEFFRDLNFIAVLVSAVVFFLAGYVWYNQLFKTAWNEGMKKHGFDAAANANQGPMKMAGIFFMNFLIAFGMSFIIYHSSTTWFGGLKTGMAVSLLVVFPIIGIIYSMENKSMKLFLIDACYMAFGVVFTSVLCAAWH